MEAVTKHQHIFMLQLYLANQTVQVVLGIYNGAVGIQNIDNRFVLCLAGQIAANHETNEN
jgi:spore maturation protein SpmB